jgi:adenosylcobinamide kinase/adenosylcobinamide-phosphate guanylyltransferase
VKVLYLGGARSGKSSRAQAVAERLGPRRLFVATAEPLDDDMRDRIARHRADRGPGWSTVEEPVKLGEVLAAHAGRDDVVLVDCLTLWVSNLLCRDIPDPACREVVEGLCMALRRATGHVIVVSNEVGLGIVPADGLSRRYRDMLGRVNQEIAAASDCVVLMVAGLPVTVKGVEP